MNWSLVIASVVGMVIGFLISKIRANEKIRQLENQLVSAQTKLQILEDSKTLLKETEIQIKKRLNQ